VSPRELPWPCTNVVPGMAPVAAVLARTGETVVAVTGIRAYPAGFGFTLNLRLRNLRRRGGREFWPFHELGPHRGSLAFICVWPGRGIPTSRIEVDGAAIRAAADAAVTLWPDDPYCSDD
jgi:hypothetical protein